MSARNLNRIFPCMLLFGCGNPDATDERGEEDTTETGDGDGDGDGGDGDGDGDGGDGDGDGDGDPGDGDGDGDGELPEAPVLGLSLSQVKQFDFDWAAAAGAQYYQLLESGDVGDPYVMVGGDVPGLTTSLTVPLHFRLNASYVLRACNENGCTDSDAVEVAGAMVEAIGYFKASNTNANDQFGFSVALSDDGSTLAVGVPLEDSNATGIGANQADNSAVESGAVYVFVRDDQNGWSQQAYVKASNTAADDKFAHSVALSADGSTLAVGAWGEDSGSMGIGGNQADNSAVESGAVYVFVRDGQDAWSQQAYVKASNPGPGDYFGYLVSLSGDGSTLAVGSPNEDSNAVGIGGNEADNSLGNAGAVYVFVRDGQNQWTQQAYVKASNTATSDYYAQSMMLSDDGNTLAVGAPFEDSGATTIGGDQSNDSSTDAGAVYVYVRDGQNAWSQQAYVKASNAGMFDYFGNSLALSGDGDTLAVAAYAEDSIATGIGGNQADNTVVESGAVYVFVRDGQNAWSQQAYVKASNTEADDLFGFSVALSGDGNALAVGALAEDSGTTGIGGNQVNNSESNAGAVFVFARDGQNAWSQRAYVKASNPGVGDQYGNSVSLSGDGNTLAVGAFREGSGAMGISGNQADNSVAEAGAVYLY